MATDWLGSALLAASILATGLGWLVVYKLDRRKARGERDLHEKTVRYHSVFFSLQKMVRLIQIFEAAQELPANKTLTKKLRTIQAAGLMFTFPGRESTEIALETLGDDIDFAKTEEVVGSVTLEALLSLQEENLVLQRELAFLQLMGYDPGVRAQIEKVAGSIGSRLTEISAEKLLSETSLKGAFKRGEFAKWFEGAVKEINEGLSLMQKDLQGTL